jgi:two-component system sensor histidine kinase YesM
MQKKVRNFKIKTKIVMLYISILILSIIFTVGSFTVISENQINQESGNASMQTVNALKERLTFLFENATQFSNIIYYDSNVQKALSRIKFYSIDATISQPIQKSLTSMLLSGDYISSVFIFDNYGNYYSTYKNGPIYVNKGQINKTNWFNNIKKANGKIMFIHNSEGVLMFSSPESVPSKKNDRNYISLVRVISDMNNAQPLAMLMITVDEMTFQKYFNDVGKKYNSNFSIVDSNNNYVIKPAEYTQEMDKYMFYDVGEQGYSIIKNGREKNIVVRQSLGINDWSIVGVIPVNSSSYDKFYMTWIIIIVFLNIFFVFTCSILLTKLIFNPLSRIERHMKAVESGHFIEMPVETNKNNEITEIKSVFNHMIHAINQLIVKVKSEEKIIAQKQLGIIQAQITPHFLYNTLDAISALALIKDNDNCFKMTQALGSFYRHTLNNGLDFVTVNDEIECIKSYITILNIRYDNKITLKTDIDDNIKNYKILKLILQPAVENAVHHGIRAGKGSGIISIKAYKDENEIIFCIANDGVGMTEERINKILTGKMNEGKSGFGLYSSIQMISLYYNIKNPITITSELGCGTEVTIRIKADVNVDKQNISVLSEQGME